MEGAEDEGLGESSQPVDVLVVWLLGYCGWDVLVIDMFIPINTEWWEYPYLNLGLDYTYRYVSMHHYYQLLL